MSIEIRVPQLPESVADATLVAWRKQPGEGTSRDENLADLETDKVVLEVPAPAHGALKQILIQAGTTVRSGDLLAIYEPGAAAAGTGAAAKPVAAAAPASTLATPVPAPSAAATASAESAKLSPAVRRMVEENKLDPGQIAASGRDGRLTKSDVVGHLGKQGVATAAGAAPAIAAVPAVTPVSAVSPVSTGARAEQRVPMSRLRQRIAERLLKAQHDAALLSTFNEVDLTAVNELRARYKDKFEKAHGVKLGFMSFFVKAAIEALKKYPVVNASIEGTEVLYHEYYDIGVAVSTDRGLVVPIVRDADLRSFADVEKQIGDYGLRARSGQLSIEELTGGTFTITNGGVFGSLLSTPIVNAPQSAILGMHKIQERPVAMNGQVVIRPMMYLALSYDHRIIDGRDAVQFLVTLKDGLEDPGRMLLGV